LRLAYFRSASASGRTPERPPAPIAVHCFLRLFLGRQRSEEALPGLSFRTSDTAVVSIPDLAILFQSLPAFSKCPLRYTVLLPLLLDLFRPPPLRSCTHRLWRRMSVQDRCETVLDPLRLCFEVVPSILLLSEVFFQCSAAFSSRSLSAQSPLMFQLDMSLESRSVA
jgi:hypothetical protein